MSLKSTIEHSPALIFGYFDDEWRTGVFACPVCGWRGRHDETSGPNLFRELMDFECPSCEKMLLIVGYATHEQVRDAAARGNEEAIYALGVSGSVSKRQED